MGATNSSKITAILDEAGSNYKIQDPSTWPAQAKLADKTKWQELIKYQRFLGGGKESATINSGSWLIPLPGLNRRKWRRKVNGKN
ncbi:MAG: hypothetical protein ACI8VT_001800 [Saprospiraceae bacterium]